MVAERLAREAQSWLTGGVPGETLNDCPSALFRTLELIPARSTAYGDPLASVRLCQLYYFRHNLDDLDHSMSIVPVTIGSENITLYVANFTLDDWPADIWLWGLKMIGGLYHGFPVDCL